MHGSAEEEEEEEEMKTGRKGSEDWDQRRKRSDWCLGFVGLFSSHINTFLCYY